MIKIGIAGTRGLSVLKGLQMMDDVKVTVMCDLSEDALADAAKKLDGDVKQYRVFEDMLESDIDAVIIATPMQCHVPQAIAALEAGKHVMSEVTAGVTMDELFWLCECVEKYQKVYMYAENYIFTPQVQLVKEMVQAGLFGEPYYAEGSYIHNCGGLAVRPDGSRTWRAYWQMGRRGNFYPTHSLGPVMQWFPGEHIAEISTYSPGVWNELGLKQDSGTTTMCRTNRGKLIQLRTDCLSPRPHSMDKYLLQGTKGIFESAVYGRGRLAGDIDRVSLVTNKTETGAMDWEDLMNYKEFLPDRYKNATPDQIGAGHGGGDFFIVEEFIGAVRKNEQPALDVYTACEWTAVGLLSALSVTNGSRTLAVPRFRPAMPLEEKRTGL